MRGITTHQYFIKSFSPPQAFPQDQNEVKKILLVKIFPFIKKKKSFVGREAKNFGNWKREVN